MEDFTANFEFDIERSVIRVKGGAHFDSAEIGVVACDRSFAWFEAVPLAAWFGCKLPQPCPSPGSIMTLGELVGMSDWYTGPPSTLYINDFGLTALSKRANAPFAKEFAHWVVSAVMVHVACTPMLTINGTP